ncbi:unnamed protein product [Caenorhabditis auriculariae]|uniref:Uncharacterized protein n=1 Tax=Caenorhabditis auriculariae TaxID=2777116 RepID=A0A8S1HH31_9PELO|nr:unnamed protein product [Caenorhabditis auriculariae]
MNRTRSRRLQLVAPPFATPPGARPEPTGLNASCNQRRSEKMRKFEHFSQRRADLSVLGYDCAHFSERGLSLLHLAMWNALVTRAPSRLAQYRPSTDPILCPDPKCPFLRTAANSDLCVFAPLDESYISMMSHVIVIVVLVITIILACLILFCVCNSRRVSHVSKTPAKAFGASFSSIKFIDEDVI